MTDKQIIIDGVDVSGCIYYEYNMCTATKDNYGDCSLYCQDYDMKSCYYKQLKSKEQENERLKSELQAKELELIMAKADLCRGCQYKNDYKAKEQECERLKKAKKATEEASELFVKNADEIARLLENKLDQLKQTLNEIEEFCIVYSDNHDAYENVYKHILEIINEAKDGEE